MQRWKKVITIIIIVIIFIISFFAYSRYVAPKKFSIKEYVIRNSNIPNGFYGTKIVHISDIHYKSATDYLDLKKIINKINLIKPDIVILSGDIFDKDIKYTANDYNKIKKLLTSIDYNISKYAIKGDSDLNIKKWEEIINDSNFINLNDTYDYIYNESLEPIFIVGISSNYKNSHINKTIEDIKKEATVPYKYSILVLHEPDFIDDIINLNFNLALSGHSMGGKINLPFIGGIARNKYSTKYYKNYYRIDNTNLFISNGVGTDSLKLRFRNTPSINLYRLRNK